MRTSIAAIWWCVFVCAVCKVTLIDASVVSESTLKPLFDYFGLQWAQGKDACDQTGSQVGIECDDGDDVFEIEFIKNTFTPSLTLPGSVMKVALAKCKKLKILSNSLRGSLPAEFFQLPVLEEFELSGNPHVSGQLQTMPWSTLGLKEVELKGNGFTGEMPAAFFHSDTVKVEIDESISGPLPTSFCTATSLEKFSIADTSISGTIPTCLGAMTDLEELDLSNSNMMGPFPEELQHCTKLAALKMQNCKLQGAFPDIFAAFANLEELDLRGTGLTGPLPDSLVALVKGSSDMLVDDPNSAPQAPQGPVINDTAFHSLFNALGVQWMQGLSGCEQTGVSVEVACASSYFEITFERFSMTSGLSLPGQLMLNALSNAKVLKFLENGLVGGLPDEFFDLPKLEELEFYGNPALGGELHTMPWSKLYVTELEMKRNNFSGMIPDGWFHSGTRQLEIAEPSVYGTLPATICNATSMEKFQVSDAKVTGSVPECVGTWIKLEELVVSDIGISGTVPASLQNCRKLAFLSFKNSRVEGVLPDIFGNFEGLVELNFKGTRLVGPPPPSLLTLIQGKQDMVVDRDLFGCTPGYQPGENFDELDYTNDQGEYCIICTVGRYGSDGIQDCRDCAKGTYGASEGMQSCTPADPGYYVGDVGMREQQPCPVGNFSIGTQNFACEPCAKGSFSAVIGVEKCEQCSSGAFANLNGMSACNACPKGRATSKLGSTECARCSPGKAMPHTNASACVRCDISHFAADLGMEECTPCPPGLITIGRGASNDLEECICISGMFLSQFEPTMACRRCLGGTDCASGAVDWSLLSVAEFTGRKSPEILQGFMTLVDAYTVYKCKNTIACPGGDINTCAANHAGIACGLCEKGFYKSGSKCEKCGSISFLPIVLLIVGVVIGISAMVFVINRVDDENAKLEVRAKANIAAQCSIFAAAFQALGVFDQIAVDWFSPVDAFVRTAGIFSFDVEFLQLECNFDSDALGSYIFRVCLCPALLILVVVVATFKKRIRIESMMKADIMNTCGTVCSLFFTPTLMSAVAPMVCYKHPDNSGWSMYLAPEILCWDTTEHTAFVLAGVGAILIVPVPFMANVVYAIVMYRSWRISKDIDYKLRSFKFLFYRYRPQCYYFGLFVLVRSCLICFCPVLYGNDVSMQICAMSTVLGGYLLLQVQIKPWPSDSSNLVDTALTMFLQIVLLFAMGIMEGTTNIDSLRILAVVVTSIVITLWLGITLSSIKIRCTTPSYDDFICHHKQDSAAQARFLFHYHPASVPHLCGFSFDRPVEFFSRGSN